MKAEENTGGEEMKEELIKYVMLRADTYYSDDFPISEIETWIREFFDKSVEKK